MNTITKQQMKKSSDEALRVGARLQPTNPKQFDMNWSNGFGVDVYPEYKKQVSNSRARRLPQWGGKMYLGDNPVGTYEIGDGTETNK